MSTLSAPPGHPKLASWCLDKEDLCIAKLCARREKDRNLIGALMEAHRVDPNIINQRLDMISETHSQAVQAARQWLRSFGD